MRYCEIYSLTLKLVDWKSNWFSTLTKAPNILLVKGKNFLQKINVVGC